MWTCNECGFQAPAEPPALCPRCGVEVGPGGPPRVPPPPSLDLGGPPASSAKRSPRHGTIFGLPESVRGADPLAPTPVEGDSLDLGDPAALTLGDLGDEPLGALDDPLADIGKPALFDDDDDGPLAPLGGAAEAPSPPAPPPVAKRPPIAPPPRRSPPPLPRRPPPTSPSDLDLPTPVELDLPAPAGLDLPAPAGADLPAPLDLPTPAVAGLPTPAHVDLPLPADLPEPSRVSPMPAPTPTPHAASPAGATRRGPAPEASHEPTTIPTAIGGRMPSPAPKKVPFVLDRRILAFGGLALVLALGAGAMLLGVFDPAEDVEPNSIGTVAKPRDPDAPAQERAPEVLAKLALDDPKAYEQAAEMASAIGDKVGQAEGLLLLHVRYGPDPVWVGQARSLLEQHARQTDPFVQRVMGLLALASDDSASASSALTGNEPRLMLYRGLLELGKREYAAAHKEATAVLAERPGEVAAEHVRLAAACAQDPGAALPDLRKAVEAHPGHLLLSALLVETLAGEGLLSEARKLSDALTAPPPTSKIFQARVLALRGRIAAAAGDRSAAILRFQQALELAPEDRETRITRIRTLMDGREFGQAKTELEVWLRDHADHTEAQLLQAEHAILTGDGDGALKIVDQLAGKLPDDPRLSILRGDVFAMRMAVDDARAAYASALTANPVATAPRIAEAEMLAKARNVEGALEVLANGRKAVEGKPGAAHAQAALRRAEARILVELGRANEAVVALDAALTVAPNDNDAQLERGRLRLQLGDREGARQDLVRVFERTGGYPGLTGPLGRLYLRQGQIAELAALVGKQADDPRATEEVILVAARLRLAEGKVQNAKGLVDKVLVRDPGSWEAQLVNTQVLVADGDYQAALVAIQQARPRTPNAEVELWLGKTLEYNDRTSEALAHYQRALQIESDLVEARFLRGRILAYAGTARQAIGDLEQVVRETDAFPAAHLALGLAQRDLGQLDKAVQSFHRATELDAKLGEAFYWEGRLHNDRNEHARTIDALEKATAVARVDETWRPHAYRILGRALIEVGRKPEAERALRKYLEIAASNDAGQSEVERLLRLVR